MESSPLEMIRRFVADNADKEAGMWLVTRGKQVETFLENDMNSLTKDERLKFYGLMEGFFPKHFERILTTQLTKETDVECLKLLQAISDMQRNRASSS
jgi:hypothetical protein